MGLLQRSDSCHLPRHQWCAGEGFCLCMGNVLAEQISLVFHRKQCKAQSLSRTGEHFSGTVYYTQRGSILLQEPQDVWVGREPSLVWAGRTVRCMRAHTCPTLCIHGERPELSPTCQVSYQLHPGVMKAAQAFWRSSWFIHVPVNCFLHNVFSLLLYWFYQLLSVPSSSGLSEHHEGDKNHFYLQAEICRSVWQGCNCQGASVWIPQCPHSLSVGNMCCTPATLSWCQVPMGQPGGEKLQQL